MIFCSFMLSACCYILQIEFCMQPGQVTKVSGLLSDFLVFTCEQVLAHICNKDFFSLGFVTAWHHKLDVLIHNCLNNFG
ncbi:unnamed protein product [Coffea canephora]|uniref:Secreted protein n=1 Tax=Coffea canephora TaxID=49390 RepID=A0A068UMH7_COFCA|nr:unnamed protein product [Coffea canephora]